MKRQINKFPCGTNMVYEDQGSNFSNFYTKLPKNEAKLRGITDYINGFGAEYRRPDQKGKGNRVWGRVPEEKVMLFRKKLAAYGNKPLVNQVGGDHYKKYKIQPVVFCRVNKVPALESTVIKYALRHKDKNGAEDIRKAIHCLEMILELDYEENP